MRISIIIPTLNEEIYIRGLLIFLVNHQFSDNFEIIVVDGGSSDGTISAISDIEGFRLIRGGIPSRAIQMNQGANLASSRILYFVHADVLPPKSFYSDIIEAIKTCKVGTFRYKYDSGPWMLRINAFFTRFPVLWCRGGDQTLFVRRNLYDELGGFNEEFQIMEDFDFIRRASDKTDLHIISKCVTGSSRKYDNNNYFRVQLANLRAYRMFTKGKRPEDIERFYRSALT